MRPPATGPGRSVNRWSETTRLKVLSHGAFEADEQRVADERVADRHFVEVRQRAEERQIVEVEIVAGVDAETELVRERRERRRSCGSCARLPAARLEGARERLRVQLDPLGAERGGPLDRAGIRLDEQADADAVRAAGRCTTRAKLADAAYRAASRPGW